MPRVSKKAPEVVAVEQEVEAPEVVAPVAELPTTRPTGKFEMVMHNGKYFCVGPDGRILTPASTQDEIERMVRAFNK